MEKFNISKPIKYTDQQGQEKTYWANVGTLVVFDRNDGTKSRIIEIPAIGLKANAFPMKPRQVQTREVPIINANEPLPTENIPF